MALLQEYAVRNSEAAFEALVSRHAQLVYSAALRQVQDPYLAQEVSQAVFTILAAKAGRISQRTILSGWLFKTTRFVALAQNRRAARQHKYEQEAAMQSNDFSNTSDPLWEQISPLLDEALAQLGERERQAVLLRYFEDQSLAQVGTVFGAGEDAIRMRINRALEKMRKFLVKRGVVLTSATLAGVLAANSVQAAPTGLVKSLTVIALHSGAAGSGSIPTLVKAASKLMAWTKIKTTITVGTAVLLLAATGIMTLEIMHAMRAAHYPDIQGAWEGNMLLDYDGVGAGEAARTHVVLKLAKTNGDYTATADWVEMGRKDIPLGKVVYDYPSLRIERTPRDTWKLRVNADATQMVLDHAIHFIQSAPVLFLRTTAPDTVPDQLVEEEFAPRPDSALQGYWEGVFQSGSHAVPVNLKIAEQGAGTFRAEISWPEFGAVGLPMTGSYQDALVKMTANLGLGLFQGAIKADGAEMVGSWTQAGQSIPASFRRADYRAEHAFEANEDYSFASDLDLQGHWKGSWTAMFVKTKVIIRLALDIARLPNGAYYATLSNVDDFDNGPIAPSEFQYTAPDLHLKWKWTHTGYEGTLKNGRLVGVWLQGGGRFPLVFERDQSR